MKLSDAEFTSALFGELGSDPATPAAGTWRVYTKSTGLFLIDDTGTVSGPFGSAADLAAHLADTADAHDASAISYAGGTGMSATDVEAAIDELATEKANWAGGTFTGDISVPDEAYDATAWNGSLEVPTKNAVRDKIEALGSSSVSDTAYGSGWNGDTTTAPSKNAVYDKIETLSAGGTTLTSRGQWAASTSYSTGDIVSYGSCRFVRVGAGFTSGSTFDPADWLSLDKVDYDNPGAWSTATANDTEFDAINTSTLPSGWSWVNQGTATYLEDYGSGTIISPVTADFNWRILSRAVPAGSSWDVICRISGVIDQGTNARYGFGIREASSGKFTVIQKIASTEIYLSRWDSVSSVNSNPNGPFLPRGVENAPYWYARIRKNSSTSYDFMVSNDGKGWFTIAAAHNPSYMTAVDNLCLAIHTTGALSCHWLRAR